MDTLKIGEKPKKALLYQLLCKLVVLDLSFEIISFRTNFKPISRPKLRDEQ